MSDVYDMAQDHAAQLCKSERGRNCLRGLGNFLDNNCWSLDADNQEAVMELIELFFLSGHSTLEAIREVEP